MLHRLLPLEKGTDRPSTLVAKAHLRLHILRTKSVQRRNHKRKKQTMSRALWHKKRGRSTDKFRRVSRHQKRHARSTYRRAKK